MPFFAFNFSIFFNFLSPKMLITCSSSTFFLVTLLYRVFIFLPACELRSRKGIMIKLSCNACEHRSMSLECKQVAYSTEDYNKRVHKQWCILSFDYWAFSSLWLKDFFTSEVCLLHIFHRIFLLQVYPVTFWRIFIFRVCDIPQQCFLGINKQTFFLLIFLICYLPLLFDAPYLYTLYLFSIIFRVV